MGELLLELFSEDIPARMQQAARQQLVHRLLDALKAQGFQDYACQSSFVTPRRMGLVMDNLAPKLPGKSHTVRGPRVGAPVQAVEGFMRSVGCKHKSALELLPTPKGDFHAFRQKTPPRNTVDIIGEIIPELLLNFPWPKSMRWVVDSPFRWARPLRAIVCLFDGAIVPFKLAGLESGARTQGHRFLAPKSFLVHDFAEYKNKMKKSYVMLHSEEREKTIARQAHRHAGNKGLVWRENPDLLQEVAGLVEWPVCVVGSLDKKFLSLPQELILHVMEVQQKYLALYYKTPTAKKYKLAPYFIVVSNLAVTDKNCVIAKGNSRVLRARLEDAHFYWQQDAHHTLEDFYPTLAGLDFAQGLGSMHDKVELMQKLLFAGGQKSMVHSAKCDKSKMRQAVRLCKCDLVTQTVQAFPALQGFVGSLYATRDKKDTQVARAIKEHYAPQGSSDTCPNTVLGFLLSLADKIDTLAAFWLADRLPTASKDPYGLRRAALGIVRILLEKNLHISLISQFDTALTHRRQMANTHKVSVKKAVMVSWGRGKVDSHALALWRFFLTRAKVYLRSLDYRHDYIDAVFCVAHVDDFTALFARLKALNSFLQTPKGMACLVAYRRAYNISRAENHDDSSRVRPALLVVPQEKALHQAVNKSVKELARWGVDSRGLVQSEASSANYLTAAQALVPLSKAVDAFLDNVRVQDEKPTLRANRLALVARVCAVMNSYATFSCIQEDG